MNLLLIQLTDSIPCWLIPLLVGLLCAILGYLLGRLFGKGNDSNDDIELWKRKNASLKADLDMCRSKLDTASKSPAATRSAASTSSSFAANSISAATTAAVTAIAFDGAAAKAVFDKKIKENDLTIVEGIGPKIKELFHNFNITTWASLADTSIEKCQEVLNSGGKRFEIHRPNSWPKQAKLAAEGKWAELKKWQDEHDYGKE